MDVDQLTEQMHEILQEDPKNEVDGLVRSLSNILEKDEDCDAGDTLLRQCQSHRLRSLQRSGSMREHADDD